MINFHEFWMELHGGRDTMRRQAMKLDCQVSDVGLAKNRCDLARYHESLAEHTERNWLAYYQGTF